MSRETKLAKNTFILAIGTFLPKLASFITLPILTACLSQEEYGTYDLITVLVSLLLPAVTLQIQTAAFRYLINERNKKEEVKSIITNIFAFIIPTSLIALIILYIVLSNQLVTIRLGICIYFLIDILVNATRQIVRGLSRNFDYSISAIVSAIGNMVFAVCFVWYMKNGLSGAVAALCLASSLSLFYLTFKTHLLSYIDIKYISLTKIKYLLQYSWPMVPNSMSMWVMRMSDRLVVTFFMGVSANAIYSVANKIPQLLTLAQNAFTMAWQENASIVSKDSDAEKYYSSMFITMFDLMAGFMGLLIAVTPILFELLIRGNYEDAYFQIPILLMGMFFYSMSTYLGGIYVAYMDTKSVGITTMAAATCNIVIDILFVKRIGLYAASGSTLVSYILLFVFRMFNIRKLVKMKYEYKHILVVLGCMAVECTLCFQRNKILNIINVILGCIIFFILNKTLIKNIWEISTKLLKNE